MVQQEEFRAKQGGGAAGEANEGDISTIPPNGLDGATNDISKDDRRGERTSRRGGGTHSRARMKRSICLCNGAISIGTVHRHAQVIVPRMPSLPELFAHEFCQAVIICTFFASTMCAGGVEKDPLVA